MHMSIHYNGWADSEPNPKNYTKDRTLHGRYESDYVNVAIDAAIVRPRVQPPRRLEKVWESVKDHLSQGFSDLQPMYDLEKIGEFNPSQPRSKGTDFIASQLARHTMLSNLWYRGNAEARAGQNSRE
jgi:hypothetical protein